MKAANFLDLPPLLSARGTITLPGSKSISNRILLLSALSQGTTEIRDVLLSDDTERMLDGLRTLGIGIEQLDKHVFRLQGCGGNFPVKNAELFLGNAGTAFRPLTAALALSGGHTNFPAWRACTSAPLAIWSMRCASWARTSIIWAMKVSRRWRFLQPTPAGDVVQVRGDVSSQFLTGLLMALPLIGRAVSIEVVGELISKPYIEITLAMMARFGVKVERQGWQRFAVSGGQRYQSPGHDLCRRRCVVRLVFSCCRARSAAGRCAWKAWAGQHPGRCALRRCAGADGRADQQGPTGWRRARQPIGKLKAIDLDCNHIPDAAMTLAVAALFAEGTTTLRNIASWRVKETDRIAAMATELRKVGATVEEGADFIRITPPAQIMTRGDRHL